jgi:hypothetical protein
MSEGMRGTFGSKRDPAATVNTLVRQLDRLSRKDREQLSERAIEIGPI